MKKDQDNITKMFALKVRDVLGKNIVAVYWFGSRAKEQGGPDSDYDLMLETKTELTESQRDAIADIAVDLTAYYGVLLDIHYYTADEIRTPPYSLSPFIRSAIEEGVKI